MNWNRASFPVFVCRRRRKEADSTAFESVRLLTSAATRVSAFTLLELLVVLAIVGILVGITLPTIHTFKPSPGTVAASQLLGDISRARHLAISQRTTIYMIFLPTNLVLLCEPFSKAWTVAESNKAVPAYERQLFGYTFVSLRRLGDQPGQAIKQYLSSWHTLPEGTYIAPEKFSPRNQSWNNIPGYQIYGFSRTNIVPFPSEETAPLSLAQPFPNLPYIAFNSLGQLTSGQDEYIPISQGSVLFTPDPTDGTYQILEKPPGNTSNMFNVVKIDWITGRARLERQEVR